MFKKFLTKGTAIAMVAVMTAGFGMTTALADSLQVVSDDTLEGRPSYKDKATITVEGIEEGATVVAYKVVQANYNKYGLTRYTLLSAFGGSDNDRYGKDVKGDDEIKNIESITENEITSIASKIYAGKYDNLEKVTLSETKTSTTEDGKNLSIYSADVTAGSYIVLVTDTPESTGEWVYNPCYVSVGYDDSNDASSLRQTDTLGTDDNTLDVTTDSYNYYELNADGSIKEDKDGNKNLITAYVKKSYTTLDKDIVNASTGNTETEDVAIGDTVSFKVTSRIPYYSDSFVSITYKISDTQSVGLDTPENFHVYVGVPDENASDDESDTAESEIVTDANGTDITGYTEYEAGEDTYTLTVTDNDWVIDFNKDFIKDHPLNSVMVTYTADVNENAPVVGVTEADSGSKVSLAKQLANENKATVEFTTTPNATHKYDDTVNVYTFGIVAGKVDADDTTKGLTGAEFLLTKVDENGNAVKDEKGNEITYTATSDENGIFTFDDGIDVGTYTLVETKAPYGYFINDMVYTVEITPSYEADADGVGASIDENRTAYADEVLTGWTVKFTDDEGNLCQNATFVLDEKFDSNDTEFRVSDTILATLPTTGGMGTIALTGVAVVLFGTAAYLVFGKKKESSLVSKESDIEE
jgi:fimbrial isopeptide formation D2 family protein/LPXTG-motif cell wall-anchored protein